MPRVCTICTHPDRQAIDRALAAGDNIRETAALYRVSSDSLLRHKANHLPAAVQAAQAATDVAHGLSVMDELARCFQRVNLLFDACDRWLRDAEDPSRYDIGPRASDLMVTYTEKTKGRPVQRKAPLSELLDRIEDGGRTIALVETKHADPRDLVIKTAARLQSQTELLAKLLGELDERPQVNLLIAPEWLRMRAALMTALLPYPEAKLAVADRLQALEAAQ